MTDSATRPGPGPSAAAPPDMDALDRAARQRVCELCRQMYALGWASGTGGGFSLRQGDRIYVAPSGLPKETIQPEEVFVLDPGGAVLVPGVSARLGDDGGAPRPGAALKISACTPLFMHAYTLRGAGAVLHSHSLNACLASLVSGPTFRVRGLEMVKGVAGGHVDEIHEVPILDNTPFEHELEGSLRQAIVDFPRASAVLVRGHGVYIWGKDWVSTRTQAECYDYLFGAAVRLRELGIDPATLDRRRPPA